MEQVAVLLHWLKKVVAAVAVILFRCMVWVRCLVFCPAMDKFVSYISSRLPNVFIQKSIGHPLLNCSMIFLKENAFLTCSSDPFGLSNYFSFTVVYTRKKATLS
jgi:hypothetical protein